jgi:cell division protein FtsL
MTPPATATEAHPARPARRRPPDRRPPRRVSGPSRGARGARPAVATPRGSVAVAPPLALRLARTAARIGDARFLDRLLRGRAWIAVVAVALMGIVFIQVSMLRLNSGISRAISTSETLNRQNAALRAEISRMDSGDRIADAADAEGMILPPAGSVNYLDARKADGAAAARAIRPPKPVKSSVGAASSGTGTSVAAAAAATGAPAPATTQQTTPPATQAQAATASQTTAPATTAPAATTPQTTVPATTAPQTTAPATTQPQAQTAPATGQGGQ